LPVVDGDDDDDVVVVVEHRAVNGGEAKILLWHCRMWCCVHELAAEWSESKTGTREHGGVVYYTGTLDGIVHACANVCSHMRRAE